MRIVPLTDIASLDAAAVIAIYDANGWGTAADYESETVRGWFRNSTHVTLTLDEDGRLVGFVRVLSDGLNTWISDIAVHPAQKRRGIGRALMTDVVARFGKTAIYGEAFVGTEGFFARFGILPRKAIVAVSRAPTACASQAA
ncbi:MAG: GNAT family N-acetyltransferase [Rhodospirillaceae bacterium]|nr:GNAT family N-acetyltransferase [Rhodospirillaceae bacterium]